MQLKLEIATQMEEIIFQTSASRGKQNLLLLSLQKHICLVKIPYGLIFIIGTPLINTGLVKTVLAFAATARGISGLLDTVLYN